MAKRDAKKRSRSSSVWGISNGGKRTPINEHANCSGRSEGPLTVVRDKLMERAQGMEECVAAITEYISSLPAATSCTEGAVYAGAGCVDGKTPRDIHEVVMSGAEFDGGTSAFICDMVSAKVVSIVTPREAALSLQELTVLRELGVLCATHRHSKAPRAVSLKRLRALARLRVKSNFINNSDVECAFRIGTLEEVAVTDSMQLTSIEGISQLANLKVLKLDSTGIGDDCLKEICACSELTQLSVSGSIMITDVTPISKLVKLKALNLSNCHHITKGIAELGQVPLLCDMDLSGTSINDGNLMDLCVRGILERLKLNNCIQFTSVNPLSGLTALGELDLTGCRRVTRGVDTLGTLSVLRVLRLREVNLDETIIEGIGGSRALVSLSVESCTGLADVAPLSHIETLEKLEIRSCNSTISGVGNLGAVPRLRVLSMANVFFPPAGIDDLGASKSLVQFAVESATGLHDVTPLASILTLEEVSLRGCGCVVTGIGCLGSLPRLRALDLTYTVADNDAFSGICASESLVSLNLSRCLGITDVSCVSQLRTLSELNLSGCRAIRVGWAELGKVPQLRVAVLSNTRITDGDVLSLSGLERLVTLDLSLCDEILDVTALSTLSTLEELNVEGCSRIMEAGICSLGGLPQLRVLKMRSVSVSDAAVRSLGNCRTLFKLILDNCTGFTDATPFSRLTAVEELSLHYCDTVVSGMGTLGMLSRLRTLDVGRTYVDDASLYGICTGSHSLVSLNLSNCKRVTCISAIAALKSLEELNLGNCCNITTGWEALGALQQLRVAVLSDTHIDDEGLHHVSECKCLTSLDLTSCLDVTNVTVLSSVTVLEELMLDGCRNIKTDIGALGALPRLRVLNAKEVEVDDPLRDDDPLLGRCKSLVRLSASRSEGGIHGGCLLNVLTLEEIALDHRRVYGIPSLMRMPWLRVLNLKYTDIGDGAIKGISESKSLQSLNLSHCRKISDISRLSALTTLEELNINCCGIKTGWEALGELRQLRVAILSETGVTDEVIASLAACQYLRKLKLYNCGRLTDVTAVYQMKSLEELIVRNCLHVRKGLNALGTLPPLRFLALRNVRTSDLSVESIGCSKSLVKIIIESCEEFVDAAPLSNTATLEELTVRNRDQTVVNIGHLGGLPRLRFLALLCCDVDDGTLEDICASRSLVSLDLKRCDKMTTIAPLVNLSSLESLNLEGCQSVARGWEALSKLPRLRDLRLRSTRVNNSYAAHHISECSFLVALNLESCDMADASCLADMRTLEELHIGRCGDLTEGLGKLFSLPRLRVLDLVSSDITGGDLHGTTPSDSIEELDLSWCERLTDVTALGRIKSVKKLHLRQSKHWNGRIEGHECLLELPHLRWVDLDNVPVPYPIIDELRKRRVHVP